MKKSEVIKLMKEGTHCIYNDCLGRVEIIGEIIYEVSRDHPYFHYKYYYRFLDGNIQSSNFQFKGLTIINLSEIEPDNENPYLFYEGEKYYFGEEYEFKEIRQDWVKATFLKYDSREKDFSFIAQSGSLILGYQHIRKIDHKEKLDVKGVIKRISEYSPDEIDLLPFDETRKKDHIYCIEWGMQKAKRNEYLVYQKLFLELKEQAEKDGVNLKEIL